ncbi:MAG TPA: aminotransferase class V-fold PLP-dependent enzyme [Verrucomicrobiae bacterium]|nr:aminotransferase class V-fold PLP-dependent enzyme [Verrucomicrobiae bacterium]
MTLDVDPSAAADPAALDAADPLAPFRRRFVIPDPDLVYLDGNSLGRPPLRAIEHVSRVATEEWAGQLIRGWEHWLAAPSRVGDLLGTGLLGARPDEVVICDSTTVDFYRLASAALDARPGRGTIVTDRANFPTDRYVLEGLARDRDREIAWLDPDPIDGPTADAVAAALAAHPGDVALVTLSHVNYRSAAIADLPAITGLAHDAGALVLWDLSHSAGAVPVGLAEHGVDLAVGCTYKYLNGGPGAPAYLYIRSDLQGELPNPIQGWFGQADQFEMGQGFRPRPGIAGWLTGTPGMLGLAAAEEGIRVSVEAGIDAIRAKGIALTEYAIALHDAWLAPLGFSLGSPREAARRGAHVAVRRSDARELTRRLIEAGVVPDFRAPDSVRLGLSPLTTSFSDVARGVATLARLAGGGPANG